MHNMFDVLLAQWQAYRGLTGPAPTPIQLWAEGGRSVWISDSWGPAVPYDPVDHGNGHKNHGYVRIKGDAEAARRIPEAVDLPSLVKFLITVNATESPIESVGCEKGFFPVDVQCEPTVKLGVYIDVIFTDAVLNENPENALLLASHLLRAIEGCEKWWGDVSMVLQRMRFIAGTTAPWGLMVRIDNYGRNREEASKFWSVTGEHLANAVAGLAMDFT